MNVSTITIDQFKAQFPRDFPYFSSIQYDNSALYNKGDEIYYPTTKLFYVALVDGVTGILPTDATKWIKYADNTDNWVQDADITRAFAEAQISFNPDFFSSDADITLAFLYMAAFWLANDLRASRAGINATGYFPLNSRTVGSVSESYTIPQAYMDDPILAAYTQNAYGMKYLTLALPNMRGNVVGVYGGTHA